MINKIKKLSQTQVVRDTVIYGVTNMLYSGLPLLLMPFLVTVMNPEDYGIIDFFRSLTLVITPILGLSTVNSISRFFYDLETKDFKTFVSSVIAFHFFMALNGVLLIFLISFFLPEKYLILSVLSIVFFLFNQITEALLQIYRVTREAKNYLIIRVGGVVIDLILLTVFYFVLSEYDWSYRIFPNIISVGTIGLISVFIFYRKGYSLVFNYSLLKTSIVYSSPLVLHMLSGYVLNLGDRFFILHFLDEKELGRYAVAYQIGMAVNFFYTSFNLAWTPTFYEWMKNKKFNQIRKVKKIVYTLIPVLGGIIFLIFLVLNNQLQSLQKYNISTFMVLVITMSYVIFSLYKFQANYYLYNKNTKTLSKITFISSLSSVIANIILIPLIGIMGAAIATLFSFLFLFIFVSVRLKNGKEFG